MKKNKRVTIAAIAAIFLITFLPLSPENLIGLFSHANIDEEGNITGYEVWDQDRVVDMKYTVQPGATLVVKNGVTLTFKGGSINVKGDMFVNGTVNHPTILKKTGYWNYYIDVQTSGKLVIKNADISGTGFGPCTVMNNSILNQALACPVDGGINVYGGWLDIEASNIHDNNTPIYISDQNLNRVKVNRNKFSNNKNWDVYYYGTAGSQLNFKYNWWGSSAGPTVICWSPSNCYHEKLFRDVDFSNYLTQENFRDPVLIVPGIMGSAKKDGQWVLDPVGHVYDNLYAEFVGNEYVPEKDLFTFGYDWENSNVDTAKLLAQKIQEVKEKTHWPKVDIVAHSMGGLVARQYVELADYQDDVDQLITLATPNNGAPEAYLKWEGDAWFWGLADLYGKHILDQEVAESDGQYADRFDYVHNKPVASLQQLLPVYNYLQDVQNGNNDEIYPSGYPRNGFLENLNNSTNIAKLNNVEFDKIVGNAGDDAGTIAGFKVIKSSLGKLWTDGYPLGFEIIIGDRGIIKSGGDRTVPIDSAKSEKIFADYTKEINSTHTDLPTEAQSDVLEILTNKRPTSEVRNSIIHNILFAQVYSPVDIQVVAPDGKHWAGKNINGLPTADKIAGAYYTGYAGVKNEFLTIPNPEDGEYKIITEGTDEGKYTVEVSKLSEDGSGAGQATESTADITGTAVKDRVEESQATISGSDVIAKSVDSIPPTITATVMPTPNVNGWNNTDVTAHFDATDESGIKAVTPDVTFSAEGKDQTILGEAEDNAGNKNSVTVKNINIDKTKPVATAELSGAKGNGGWYVTDVTINFSATDNLSGVDEIFYALDGADVQSGNALKISDDGAHQIRFFAQDLAENREDEKTLEIKIDKTAPEIQITSPQNKSYANNTMLALEFRVSDGQSLADKISTEIFYDGNVAGQNKLDLSLEHLGAHNFSVSATDEAGNQSEKTQVDFQVVTSIGAIAQNVNHYFNLGLITKENTKTILEFRLRNIQEMLNLLSIFQSKWMPAWAKEKVVENLKRSINNQIDVLENQIERDKNFQRAIDQKIQEILAEDLEGAKV
ncbi:MAG: alpha/beta hydrolase [Candidatus Moranbacteria bacterium]|nr:alpha/beta hydrolase [Candidatus Moranbacteria bacterium]